MHLSHLGELCFLDVRALVDHGVIKDFNLSNLAQSFLPLPKPVPILIIVDGKVSEEKHLLLSVRGHEASQKISMVCCTQLIRF